MKGIPNLFPKIPSPCDVSGSEHGAVGSRTFICAGLDAYSVMFLLTTLMVLGRYHSCEDRIDSCSRSNDDGKRIENSRRESFNTGEMCSPYPTGVKASQSDWNLLHTPLPFSHNFTICI